MANLVVTTSSGSFSLRLNGKTSAPCPQLHSSSPACAGFSGGSGCRKTRGVSVVTRAGLSASNYIFAFVFPLSLLAITIFTSIRIADRLDKDFLEELAVNQAILEEEEGGKEEDGANSSTSLEEETAASPALRSRSRNRPKREADRSSV